MKKSFLLIFIAGLVIRLILSITTYHPDVQAYDLAGYVLKNTNPLNFYNYLYLLDQDNPIVRSNPPFMFNYPPSAYLFLGYSSLIFTIFTPSQVHENFLTDVSQAFGNISLNMHLLSLKLPYFFFDILCAYLLMKMVRRKILVFALWFFNPVNLYATYMMGQHDIIPVFFVILAAYLASKSNSSRNLMLAAVALGIGASFKIFPFLLLIPLAALTNSWIMRIKIVFAGLIPYLLVVLPFFSSFGYRNNALVASQTDKSLFAQIPVSGGESIMLFLAFLFFFYFLFLYRQIENRNIWQLFFLILLLFFIFTHYHPQWLLWLSPLLIMEMESTRFKNLLANLTIILTWFLSLFFFDPSLTIGLFAPVSPNLYQSASLWQILGINIDYNFARSILQTIFAGSAVYLIYLYFPRLNRGS